MTIYYLKVNGRACRGTILRCDEEEEGGSDKEGELRFSCRTADALCRHRLDEPCLAEPCWRGIPSAPPPGPLRRVGRGRQRSPTVCRNRSRSFLSHSPYRLSGRPATRPQTRTREIRTSRPAICFATLSTNLVGGAN